MNEIKQSQDVLQTGSLAGHALPISEKRMTDLVVNKHVPCRRSSTSARSIVISLNPLNELVTDEDNLPMVRSSGFKLDPKEDSDEFNRSVQQQLISNSRKRSYQAIPAAISIYQSILIAGYVESLQLSTVRSSDDLQLLCLKKCQKKLSLPLIKRAFVNTSNFDTKGHVSVMQWNVLSQAIGYYFEGFVTCSNEHLKWSARKWKIVYEIAQYHPDVICLQEVDKFGFLQKVLHKIGYEGKFLPKPDSPCYHITGNSGPDGCAIFYNVHKFTLIKISTRIVEVLNCQTNQVILVCHLKCKLTGKTFCVATTHLKARKSTILSEFRNEQGKDILAFLSQECAYRPIILTGDFNAEKCEPVYSTMTSKAAELTSAYCEHFSGQTIYSNWTRRQNEEETKQMVDYVFYSKNSLRCVSALDLRSKELIAPMPNDQYPSDHLSLVASFQFSS